MYTHLSINGHTIPNMAENLKNIISKPFENNSGIYQKYKRERERGNEVFIFKQTC